MLRAVYLKFATMDKRTTISDRLLDVLMIALMAAICFLLMGWK